MKASLTLGILLGMFFVTWLPFFVANIAQVMPLQGAAGESRPPWEAPKPHLSPGTGGRKAGCRSWRVWLCLSPPCWVEWSVFLPWDQA